MPVNKTTIEIGGAAKIELWRDGEWVILYVEDGGGGKTTVSLDTQQALDLATLMRGRASRFSAVIRR
jgi:hypothetical protein